MFLRRRQAKLPQVRGRPRIYIDRATVECAGEQLKQLVRAGRTWADAEQSLAAELGVSAATLRSRLRAYRRGDMRMFEPPATPVAASPERKEPSPEDFIKMLENLLS
jgi:hypothetical protein